LKHFTEALAFYQKYRLTGSLSKLNYSRDHFLKAFNSELGQDNARAFLINIGLAYLNENLYDEAERIFRYPKILKPDLAALYTGFVHWRREIKLGSSLNSVGKGITIYHNPLSNKSLCQSPRKNSSG